jgi:predicted lipid-binding transport protein (Tim44 family)|tara:strand:- start:22608 stop:23030 length:423 start_codon:yes stop_codon:yes gene_type:complete
MPQKKFKDIVAPFKKDSDTLAEEREQRLVDNINVALPEERVAEYIAKHSDVEITDKLVEEYMNKAANTDFNVDPILTEIKIRSIRNLRDKIDYVLKDGSKVAISEKNQILLNSLLKDNSDIVSYMSENKNNFIEVLKGVY